MCINITYIYILGVRLNGSLHTRTPSTLSLASTTTSHASSDWQPTEEQKDGKTFKQSVSLRYVS